jgi:hypothetical protein
LILPGLSIQLGVEQMYNKASDVIRLCEKENKKISEIAILKEVKMRNLTEENVINEMKNVLEVMKNLLRWV